MRKHADYTHSGFLGHGEEGMREGMQIEDANISIDANTKTPIRKDE
jgi:hypothetical protein